MPRGSCRAGVKVRLGCLVFGDSDGTVCLSAFSSFWGSPRSLTCGPCSFIASIFKSLFSPSPAYHPPTLLKILTAPTTLILLPPSKDPCDSIQPTGERPIPTSLTPHLQSPFAMCSTVLTGSSVTTASLGQRHHSVPQPALDV